MRRRITIAIFFCVVFLSENVSASEIIGLVLDFPPGSIDQVTKIELFINSSPYKYAEDLGYNTYTNYISHITDGYVTEPVIPGALGLDWQRIPWSSASPKITYVGTDPLQSGIVDGYEYQFNYPNYPIVTDVKLTGYPGRIKFTYPTYLGRIYYGFLYYDALAIIVEPDLRLEDAIMSLQISVGMNPSLTSSALIDINADGKIGLQEAVYILQKIAGLRERF